jgi:regulatory LuxR family protein
MRQRHPGPFHEIALTADYEFGSQLATRDETPRADVEWRCGVHPFLSGEGIRSECLLSMRRPCPNPGRSPRIGLIAEGNANREIAEQLSVSEETVKGQVATFFPNGVQKTALTPQRSALKRGIIEV